MNTFQFTVSTDPAELRKTAGMLRAMADSLENSAESDIFDEANRVQPAAAFPPPAPPIPDFVNMDFPPLPEVTGTQSPTADYAADVTLAPPAPPTPPAPPAPPAPANPAGKELDKNGLPFDARIHTAGENRMNKDGTWKYMRGLLTKMTQSDVDRIEAENRAAVAAPVVPAPTAPVSAPVAPVVAPVPAPPTPIPVPPAPPTSAPVPPAPAGAAAPSVTTWVQLNQACVTRGLGKDMMAVDLGRLGPIFAARGLTNFMSLYQRQDLIPAVMADILNAFPVVQ